MRYYNSRRVLAAQSSSHAAVGNRLEMDAKFWQVAVRRGSNGLAETVTTFGPIGSGGQTNVKFFDSVLEADEDAAKMVGKKRNEGYKVVAHPTT